MKIRIHFLEENQGLGEKAENQDNVYRINLDLKVANQCLQQDIEEKDAQIRDALQLLNQLEEESKNEKEALENNFELERRNFRAEIEDLKNKRENQAEVRQSLLGEAFGSMILESAPENSEKVDNLEAELNIEKDHNEDLKRQIEAQKFQMDKVHEEKINLEQQKESLEKMLGSKEEKIQILQGQIKATQDRLEILEDDIESKGQVEFQNQALISQLNMEQKSWQVQQDRFEAEINQLNEELLSLRKALDEESSSTKDHETYLNLKLAEIAQLHKEIASLKSEISSKDQELTQVKTGLEALAQVTEEQNNEKIQLMKEHNKKNLMYDRLVTEYESAKAKIRKYRSEFRRNSSTSSCTSQASEHHPQDFKASYYLRQGAEKALAKAKKVYGAQMKQIDESHASMMRLMRTRLEELANCLEQILNNGFLDISSSVRDALQASLNESRRLSVLDMSSLDVTLDAVKQNEPIEINLDDLQLDVNGDLVAEYEEQINALKREHDSALKDKDQFQSQVKESKDKIKFLEAERTEMRIRCSNLKEKLKQFEEENLKLKDKTKSVREFSKLQQENQDLKAQIEQINIDKDADFQDLRKELDEALEKIRQYRERQEKLDKTLRHQLAKTHTVLKRTKNAMDNIDNNKENNF